MKPTSTSIVAQVAARHGIAASTLLARTKVNSHARHEAMYEIRTQIGKPLASYPWIGRKMGRDHSTVMYGVRRHQKRLDVARQGERLS